MFTEQEGWDVLEDIPADSAAALILLEHHRAVPFATRSCARGFRISDGFISPLDLVAIGLVSAEEAKELHELAGPVTNSSHDGRCAAGREMPGRPAETTICAADSANPVLRQLRDPGKTRQ